VEELRESTADAHDVVALRSRVRSEGYVFLRGLIDRALVERSAAVAYGSFQSAGWLEPGGPPEQAAIGLPVRTSEPAQAWTDPGYRRWAASPAFNRLPYEESFRALMLTLMGNRAFVYPTKVARYVYPSRLVPTHKGMYVHQDFSVAGVMDMFTCWVPMMDIPRDLGGLCIKPGSQGGRLVRPHLLRDDARGWLTTDYRAGDVLVFHCLTAHAAAPNRTDRMRLSGEYRWQLSDDPVPRRVVYGPKNQPVELFSRLFKQAAWWRPVPEGLTFVDGPPDHVAPSRYVDVAPGLRRIDLGRFNPH
jgi:hypothetical protein